MTSPVELTKWVEARLAGIPKTSVYVGAVPTQVPLLDAQSIAPYVVVWPAGPGLAVEEALQHGTTGIVWGATVTVAAHNTITVLSVAQIVHDRLNLSDCPGLGLMRRVETGARVQADPDVSLKPSRLFLPLEFRAETAI